MQIFCILICISSTFGTNLPIRDIKRIQTVKPTPIPQPRPYTPYYPIPRPYQPTKTTVVNACSTNPCLNGGLCAINYNTYPNNYICTCIDSFSGPNCQTLPALYDCMDTNANCQSYASSQLCNNVYSINGLNTAIYSICRRSCGQCVRKGE